MRTRKMRLGIRSRKSMIGQAKKLVMILLILLMVSTLC